MLSLAPSAERALSLPVLALDEPVPAFWVLAQNWGGEAGAH